MRDDESTYVHDAEWLLSSSCVIVCFEDSSTDRGEAQWSQMSDQW